MNITRGPVKSAIKMLVYGPEGVGKTTFAAMVPGVVFIDTEGSTRHMDVARFDPPMDLQDVLEDLNYVLGHPEEFPAVAIDTVDWLEKFIFNSVCAEKKLNNIEDLGYGKGYVYAKQKMQQLLEILQAIVDHGTHVILVCHSIIRKFEQPDEMGSYDRYMLKLNEKNIAPLVKEWVDLMLFVNYRTNVITDADGKTKKGTGGQKRIMYANHTACWDAKNRFGLPDELPFDFEQIAGLFANLERPAAVPAAKPQQTIEDVLNTNPIEIRKDAPAEVTVASTLPTGTGTKKGKKTSPPQGKPESMTSDNPEKDRLLDELWSRMLKHAIYDPMIIQAVVADKDYYDMSTQIRDYDTDFIEGCLIEAWDTVLGLALTKQNDLPF